MQPVRLLAAAGIAAFALVSSASAGTLTTADTGVARLTYLVAQHSPLLKSAVKVAISQDFNGAPLDGPPVIHKVTARLITCRTKIAPADQSTCSLTYGRKTVVKLRGRDAQDLFDALAPAGAHESTGKVYLTRKLSALSCTVDDALAQRTPAAGDDIAGFSCQFQKY